MPAFECIWFLLLNYLQAVKFLESDELLEEVETMMTDARRKGVNGVPFVVIDGKWAVSGGQTAEVYAQVSRAQLCSPRHKIAHHPL